MKKEILIISCFLLTLFNNCSKKEDIVEVDIITNFPPTNFNISIEQIKSGSALLKWDESTDPENTTIKYSIYLENDLIKSNISILELKLEGLTELTTYNGYIKAEDEDEEITKVDFTFTTKKYYLTFIKEYQVIKQDYVELFTPELHEVIITNDGGYLFSGRTYHVAGGNAFFTVKIDKNGNEVWFKKYDVTFWDGYPEIKETSDGGYMIVGWQSFLKLDSLGNIVWTKTLPCGELKGCNLHSAAETNNGDFLIGGTQSQTSDNINVNLGAYLVLINSSGDILWEKTLENTWHQSITDIIHNEDNTFIVFGDIEVTGNTGHNTSQGFWVFKIDINGNIIWEKSYGDGRFDIPKKMIRTRDNNFVFIGDSWGAYDINESVIYKINNNGDIIWNTRFSYGVEDSVRSVTESQTGDLITIGKITDGSFGEMGIYKFNSDGSLIWEKQYIDFQTNTYGYDLKTTDDNGFIIASHFDTTYPAKSFARILKTDPDGNFEK
jgi:hypothetical protein